MRVAIKRTLDMNQSHHAIRTLRSMDDIKHYFRTRERACYFISTSNFNMMGMHEWVRGWKNINLLDCFDGAHPNVHVVKDDHSRFFEGIEDINHYLVLNQGVQDMLHASVDKGLSRDQVLFLFFDDYLEEVCEDFKLEVALPRNRLVREVDSKIVTTEIGNAAGVPSVPNVLARVSSYADLQSVAQAADLGNRLVVQTAYGDSGKTTFFIASETDYRAYASQIEAQDVVKVMRRVRCTASAIEACATRWGTFVGPLLTELFGVASLTPYAGGWCGNELYEAAFSPELRSEVQHKTQAMGDALYQRGYRGYFELDYLIDQDTGAVCLGELNARITGVSAITNMSDFSQANLPLFLFHLLEYDAHVDLQIDLAGFNQNVLRNGAAGVSSQVILKYTDEALKVITQAPVSGVYRMGPETRLTLKQTGHNRRDALADDEAYVLRIMAEHEYAYRGGDLAIMFVNQVIRAPQGELNAAGERWVDALKQCFDYRPLTQEERALVELVNNPANVKSGRTQ